MQLEIYKISTDCKELKAFYIVSSKLQLNIYNEWIDCTFLNDVSNDFNLYKPLILNNWIDSIWLKDVWKLVKLWHYAIVKDLICWTLPIDYGSFINYLQVFMDKLYRDSNILKLSGISLIPH